jgi:hypothetical protein
MADPCTNDALRPEITANGSTNEVEEACKALVCPARRDEKTGKGNQPPTDAFDTVQITSPPSPLPSPLPGSFIDIIRKLRNKRIYVDPLFWGTYHLVLLKVHVSLSDATDWQQASLSCADLGKVSRQRLALVLQYPFHSERDENLTGLVLQTVFSFQQRLRKPIFRIQQRQVVVELSSHRILLTVFVADPYCHFALAGYHVPRNHPSLCAIPPLAYRSWPSPMTPIALSYEAINPTGEQYNEWSWK